jgi:hypothetical protein
MGHRHHAPLARLRLGSVAASKPAADLLVVKSDDFRLSLVRWTFPTAKPLILQDPHLTFNHVVAGSIPARLTRDFNSLQPLGA